MYPTHYFTYHIQYFIPSLFAACTIKQSVYHAAPSYKQNQVHVKYSKPTADGNEVSEVCCIKNN